MTTDSKGLCVVWTKYQRRAETLCKELQYEIWYCAPPFERRWLKPVGYILQSVMTIVKLTRSRPEVVFFQLPPNFLIFLGFIANCVSRRKSVLVADCHNASLRSPWIHSFLSKWSLSRADYILVHNNEVCEYAVQLGLDSRKLFVVEDLPAYGDGARFSRRESKPYAIVPCSFHEDEPIFELLEAASLAPEIEFLITGNISRARSKGFIGSAPANVKFVGFLSSPDYDSLLSSADVVIGLTKLEGIQLSVASEGLGAERPMVLSKTAILESMFKGAALYSAHDPEALALTIRRALENSAQLIARARELKVERISEWRANIQPLLLAMKGHKR